MTFVFAEKNIDKYFEIIHIFQNTAVLYLIDLGRQSDRGIKILLCQSEISEKNRHGI